MLPKDKAEDLFVKHYELIPDVIDNDLAKEYAIKSSLICAEEIMDHFPEMDISRSIEYQWNLAPNKYHDFWKQVKEEINKI